MKSKNVNLPFHGDYMTCFFMAWSCNCLESVLGISTLFLYTLSK